jgi:N-acetylglutamate synthase-like GNAT family acetyltransferase
MPDIVIRGATAQDFSGLRTLLQSCHLITEGLFEPNTLFWLAEWLAENLNQHSVIGVAGIELGQQAGLLRSVGVAPSFRSQGLGATLTHTALEGCRMTGRHVIYCFSTGAGDYWRRLGFHEVPVEEVIEALPRAPQVVVFERKGWLPTEVAWRKDL